MTHMVTTQNTFRRNGLRIVEWPLVIVQLPYYVSCFIAYDKAREIIWGTKVEFNVEQIDDCGRKSIYHLVIFANLLSTLS